MLIGLLYCIPQVLVLFFFNSQKRHCTKWNELCSKICSVSLFRRSDLYLKHLGPLSWAGPFLDTSLSPPDTVTSTTVVCCLSSCLRDDHFCGSRKVWGRVLATGGDNCVQNLVQTPLQDSRYFTSSKVYLSSRTARVSFSAFQTFSHKYVTSVIFKSCLSRSRIFSQDFVQFVHLFQMFKDITVTIGLFLLYPVNSVIFIFTVYMIILHGSLHGGEKWLLDVLNARLGRMSILSEVSRFCLGTPEGYVGSYWKLQTILWLSQTTLWCANPAIGDIVHEICTLKVVSHSSGIIT